MIRFNSPRSSQRRRFATIAFAACFVLGIHHGGAAQVLCIGEDGHIEVESNGGSCCAETETSPTSDRGEWIGASDESAGDDCGACIDIPIVTPGQVAVETNSASRTDDSVGMATAIVVTNRVVRMIDSPDHHFNPDSSPSSYTNLPLIR